jgi:hypothetical protein
MHRDGLGRTQRELCVRDLEAPGRVHHLARQQPSDDVERFLESRRTGPDVGAHRGEPVLAPAEAALHDEGPLRDGGQGPDLLGDQHRVPQWEQEQAPCRGRAPFCEKAAKDRGVLVVRRGGHVLIADKQGIEPGVAGRCGPLDHPARALTRIFAIRVIARERDPDLHRAILVAGSGFDQTRTRRPSQGHCDAALHRSPRGTGYGLVWLGAAEVGQALPSKTDRSESIVPEYGHGAG